MRIVDENKNELVNPDLTAGRLEPAVIIKRGAEPIDNVKKHAWADDDYEEVKIYHPYTQEELDAKKQPAQEVRIAQLEEELKAAKILLGLEV